ncbi:MAG: ParB/RepB/Spo0J family partition protein [Hornefia sp.]|nr:ParB/RepB/Spo0J family partition protein [Hornefia sp.]
MALKMGKNAEEIAELRKKQYKMLSEDKKVTSMYTDLMMNITQEDLEVVSKDSDKIDKIVEKGKEKVVELNIEDLQESPKNCYSKVDGEKREEMIASLKSYGQITPIFVRPKESVEEYQDKITKPFEILIGHTRVDCLKEIGSKTVKAIIVSCDDIEATLLIAQSNIQREKVTAIELARAYRNTYEALKQDKNSNLKVGESKNENVGISTNFPKSQSATSVRTDEIVAEKYGISKDTLRRKMALAYCTDMVINFYNNKKLPQDTIVAIHKLDHDTQNQICHFMKDYGVNKIGKKDAIHIKEVYEEYINREDKPMRNFPPNKVKELIEEIANKKTKPKDKKDKVENSLDKKSKAEKTEGIVKKENMYLIEDEYFPEEIPRDKREEYIRDILEYVQEKGIVFNYN